ncbi:hypothetical protein N9Q14_05520 [Pseudomonadales bacterium]|nr:hypothetical protein [Pseudomonadales bacterium]
MQSTDLNLSLTDEQLKNNFSHNLHDWFTDLECSDSDRRQRRDKLREIVRAFGVFAPIDSGTRKYRHLSADARSEEALHYWERYLEFLEMDPQVTEPPDLDSHERAQDYLEEAEFRGYIIPNIWIEDPPKKMNVRSGTYHMLGSLLWGLCSEMGQGNTEIKSSLVSIAKGDWGNQCAHSILTAIEQDKSQYRCPNHLKTDLRYGSIRQLQREYPREKEFKKEFSRLDPGTFSPGCNTAGIYQTIGVLLKLCGHLSSDNPAPSLDNLTAHGLANGRLDTLDNTIGRGPSTWSPAQKQRRKFVLKLAVAHHNRELNFELLAMSRPT